MVFRAGDDLRVLQVLEDSLPPAAFTPRLWNLKGLSLARSGRLQDAVKAYESGIGQQDSLWELHMNLGHCLQQLNQGGRALAEFRRAVELAPGEVDARLALGSGYLAYRRFPQARSQLEEAARLVPSDDRVLLQRARLSDAERDSLSSWRLWTKVEARHPSAESARRLALLSLAGGDSAIVWFQRCARRDSTACDCAAAAGKLLLEREWAKQALPWLRLAAGCGEPRPQAVYNLLLAWQRLSQADSVEAWVGGNPPRMAASWGIVALARREAGHAGPALEAARRGAEMAPEDPDLLNIYAVLLHENGHPEQARRIWRKILDIDPGHAEAKKNLER